MARHLATPLNDVSLPMTKLQGFPLQAEETEGMFRLHELQRVLKTSIQKNLVLDVKKPFSLRASGGC